MLTAYKNIIQYDLTLKNSANFKTLLEPFQAAVEKNKPYTDVFAETYVLLLLKLERETEAINFLYQWVIVYIIKTQSLFLILNLNNSLKTCVKGMLMRRERVESKLLY